MAEHKALAIAKIEGSHATADGKHALFKLTTVSGELLQIAIPTGQLTELMSLASSAYGDAQKILKADPSLKHIFPTTWWNVASHPDGKNVVLSFTVEGGSELSFQIDRTAAQNMRDSLDAALGNAPISPGGDKTKH